MSHSRRRHFLSWPQPLLPQAVTFLAGAWQGPEPLDLSRWLVVVPTRQSGRRLREALAEFAARRRSAVFPPRVITPEGLAAEQAGPGVASRLQALLAWAEVLQAVEMDAFRDVFPVDPPERNFSWALRLGEQFSRLQRTLAENALRIGDISGRAPPGFPETARWQQLAALEAEYDRRLARAGLRSPHAVAGNEAESAVEEMDRIVLLATPDPIPAALAALQRVARQVPIDVVIYAPAALADAFDDWGRPREEVWTTRVLELPDFEARVRVCADATEQAVRIAGLAARYASDGRQSRPPTPDTVLGVGVADPEILPLLESEAARVGVAVFNPEGRALGTTSLYHLLQALSQCRTQPSFDRVEALARCPDFLDYLAERCGPEFSHARFLAGLDDLHREHLPGDLTEARRHARGRVADALAVVADVQRRLARETFPENIAGLLGEVFARREVSAGEDEAAAWRQAAEAWMGLLRECADAREKFAQVDAEAWWEIALRLFAAGRADEPKAPGALELQGWLELLFDDAPHLVVAGLNDGTVPEAVAEDPFLPDSLRRHLGLRHNGTRFARDAYLLQALAAARGATTDGAGGGRLDVLLGRFSAAGDPLRPSRLLLRCPDEDLPARIDFLFRERPGVEAQTAWTRAWPLQPRRTAPPARVAVTALRRWLACPFRFYLKYGLRMEAVDAGKSELDAFDFGTLCHAALEAMGREPALRDSVDAAAIRAFLLTQLERVAEARFGRDVALPLLIQLESARQRLAKFAEIQAREREAGWVIQEVERPFQIEIAGLVVSGKIDRIDRHETTGAVRVVDYKTSDSGVSAKAAHVRPARADETLPDWAVVEIDGKRRAWVDLQLPLYREALAPTWGADIACGYITLPKAVAETGLALWDDYTLEVHQAAMRCAAGVCTAIREGRFWPPAEGLRAENDEFATLFHHGVADSVAWPVGAETGEVSR